MKLFHIFCHLVYLSIQRTGQTIEPSIFIMQVELVFNDLIVNFLVELAVVQEHLIHLLQFLYDEVALVYHGLDGDSSSHEHLVDCYKFCKLFVIDHVFKSFDFIF